MPTGVVHHPRLAWDAARVVVAVADSDDARRYEWLAERLDLIGGPEYAQALSVSRTRLLYRLRDDIGLIEAGMWRARLQDLLDQRPALAAPVRDMIEELPG